MCYNIDQVLTYTRPAETAFDIVFVLNIIVTFLTAVSPLDVDENTDLRPIFKESAIKYAK